MKRTFFTLLVLALFAFAAPGCDDGPDNGAEIEIDTNNGVDLDIDVDD